MKRKIMFLMFVIGMGLCSASPSYMWTGRWSIDDYNANGCANADLNCTHIIAEEWNHMGEQYISSRLPDISTWQDYSVHEDVDATTASFLSGSRSNLDMVVYAGHGSSITDGTTTWRGLHLGCDADHGRIGPVTIGNMSALTDLGAGWNRWLITFACQVLNGSPSDVLNQWDSNYEGVQAMLGFRSNYLGIYHTNPDGTLNETATRNLHSDIAATFWDNWTQHMGLFDAFIECREGVSATTGGEEVAILTSLDPDYHPFWCYNCKYDRYQLWANNGSRGIDGTYELRTYSFGVPQY